MKRIALYFGIATALVASCSTQERDFQTPIQEDIVFYASFEQPTDEGTRVYANEDLLLRWTADDRVSIFEKNTYNQQFRFTGETGDNAGGFKKIAGDDYYTGNSIPNVVSVYPYLETTKISERGVLTVDLPAEQHYAENTFGLGANTMVSVSADNFLQYKNVGGYLMLKLYGEGVSVSSITLKGNNGETLAGKATITMPLDGTPSVSMASDAITEITLTCNTPVQLGATAEESTQFWFVVPPVSFSKGFTITIFGEGGSHIKSLEKSLSIERSKVSKMSPFEVEQERPNNIIYYTSSDETVITPYDSKVFGANLVSNDYSDGLGIITFDGNVTKIGDYAFYYCSNLSSITIPNSATSIGENAFNNCEHLTEIAIPKNVKSIGIAAFYKCRGLMGLFIPGNVTSIGVDAFGYCPNINVITVSEDNPVFDSRDNCNAIIDTKSNTLIAGCKNSFIPESVLHIGEAAFDACTELVSITIPDNVKSIGPEAFMSCSSLTNITIPEGVETLPYWCFESCSSLKRVTLPQSLLSINSECFARCGSLETITIPSHVSEISTRAFYNCRSLLSVYLEPESVITFSKGDINYSFVTPSGVFDNTNNCPIYVPHSVLDEYKLSSDWAPYVHRIQAIPAPAPEAIDLGLPSGIKWASFNLGASRPEEYGDYYAWGETEPYYQDPLTWKDGKEAGYYWASYRWCMDNYDTLTKYCNDSRYGYNGFTDTKTVLDPEDDAAHVTLGGNWRMPTDAEWTELMNNCTWTWTTQNGVNGRLVTASNGNSIFLPAAGDRFNTLRYYVGSDGDYWSSSLDTDGPSSAWYVLFNSGGVYRALSSRCLGFSIRPVYAE